MEVHKSEALKFEEGARYRLAHQAHRAASGRSTAIAFQRIPTYLRRFGEIRGSDDSIKGLSTQDADNLRAKYGLNRLTPPKTKLEWVKVCEQLTDSSLLLHHAQCVLCVNRDRSVGGSCDLQNKNELHLSPGNVESGHELWFDFYNAACCNPVLQ